VQDKLNAQKTLLKGCNHEISEAHGEKTHLLKDMSNMELQVQELEHKVSKCNKDTNDAAKLVCKYISFINLSLYIQNLFFNLLKFWKSYTISTKLYS